MALVLSEEQTMLKDSAAGFLAEKATVVNLRELRDSGTSGYDKAVWDEIATMGWAGIAIEEAYGGLGYGYTGLGIVLEQMGRNLSPSPLQSSVLVGATVIARLGSSEQKEQLLPAIAAGEQLVTLALQEGRHHAPFETQLSAVSKEGGFVLSGEKSLVLDAPTADTFLVAARTSGQAGDESGLTVFLVESGAPGLTVEARSMVDSRASGSLVLNDVAVDDSAVLGGVDDAGSGLIQALDIANIGLAAELLGLCSAAFERTVGYLQERKQFGRIIGTFQGLQHRAAEMFAELELARSIVLQALHKVDEGADDVALYASAAKAKLCEVAQRTTNEAIQMHGGIGMTDEHEIGFFLKRARVAQHTFGDYNYHLDRFAKLSGF
ncbi:MAG: acyl-CoA dehydrogenase family protein [Halioglobus sp.]